MAVNQEGTPVAFLVQCSRENQGLKLSPTDDF